jgi:hypothetical protein
MKRTQLYIDDRLFLLLNDISQKKNLSISELVRQALRKVYLKQNISKNGKTILAQTSGLWKRRFESSTEVDSFIRSLRTDDRLDRL